MNADTPACDPSECARFLRFWTEVTGVGHVTLVAIIPDGKTTTRTFDVSDGIALTWIQTMQNNGCNVYFQPNETRSDCASKPTKEKMVAALCRFADIDPLDDQFSYADERDRLKRLAAHLIADRQFPPTAIIDTGNGLQPIWAVEREMLSPEVITRIEQETKAIEGVLGAGGTHNIDRLLRLPGTINIPNKKKLGLGRSRTNARLLHSTPHVYTAVQMAALAEHLRSRLQGTDFVRLKPGKDTGDSDAHADDADVAALIEELRAAGAGEISSLGDLPAPLQDRLRAALRARMQLAYRWAGLTDDLAARGQDASRSGVDFSLAAMLKAAGFSHLETGRLLCVFAHGKVNGDTWPDVDAGLRYVARCVLRSHEPGDSVEEERTAQGDRLVAIIKEFNKRYMVVSEAGKAIIYEPALDPMLKRQFYTRMTFEDFKKLHLNRKILIGKKLMSAAGVWLESPGRRQYLGGIAFDPSGKHVTDRTLNLWRGFAVQPRAGSWERLRAHVLEVICRGDQDHFDYVMGWMAWLVQHPEKQGEVAIVLIGDEATTGKGTPAKILLHILGQHGLAISNAKHLIGNFNGHLRDTVLLFADEAFFAGDKAHVGVLKSLITEPYLTIEAKYQNPVQAQNHLHLMLASNEEWVVPASLSARRFFVLEVSDAHKGDHSWFEAIWREMENGGYEAFLHDLLQYDLTSFNGRAVPVTQGLQQQKKLSLGTSEKWWMDVLYRRYVFRSKLGLEEYFGKWHDEMTTEVLFASYEASRRTRTNAIA